MNLRDNFDLKKAKTKDLSAVKHILKSCRLPGNDLTQNHLQHFYILENDNRLSGCIGLEIYGRHALLRSLAVSEHARGEGFGTLLVKQIEEYARELNIDNIYLLTTTAEDFFAGMGYSAISRDDIPFAVKQSEEFSSICPASASAMVKNLANRQT